MMNMRFVYEPVMQAIFDYNAYKALPISATINPRLTWREAILRGEQLVAEQSTAKDFSGTCAFEPDVCFRV